MGSRSQQEQVRSLLKDAIMMLCRRGLDKTSCFSVEALIGITLDDGDVMLVNINEKMDGPGDFSSTQLGAALNKVLPPRSGDLDDGFNDDEFPGPSTSSWLTKRRILTKSKIIPGRNRRKRGRPRKIAVPDIKKEKTKALGPKGDNDDEEDNAPLDRPEDEGDEEGEIREGLAEKKGDGLEEGEMDTEDNKELDPLEMLDATIPQVGPYNCSMCTNVYKYRKCLIEHQLRVHQPKAEEEEPSSYPCGMCEKVFATKRSLTRHVVVHAEDRERFPCNICQKKFSCQRHVEFHVLTVHKGLYPYMCDFCGKRMATKASLAGHLASKHQMDKITCTKCKREYSSQATYIKHVCAERVPKYVDTVCEICNKVFEHPKQLVQHMSKHMDPKMTCEVCGRSFKWVSSLQAHKVAAHREIYGDSTSAKKQQKKVIAATVSTPGTPGPVVDGLHPQLHGHQPPPPQAQQPQHQQMHHPQSHEDMQMDAQMDPGPSHHTPLSLVPPPAAPPGPTHHVTAHNTLPSTSSPATHPGIYALSEAQRSMYYNLPYPGTTQDVSTVTPDADSNHSNNAVTAPQVWQIAEAATQAFYVNMANSANNGGGGMA